MKKLFHEFLFNIWKDEVSSFLQDKNPLLFSELNDYRIKNEIDKKLITFSKNSDDVIRNLAKLNYYYSVLRITVNTGLIFPIFSGLKIPS